MQPLFDFVRANPALMTFILFIMAVALWHAWDFWFRPLSVPKAEINAIADALIDQHGTHAEEVAYAEEARAWRRADTCEQGKWRRVRRELWRRHHAGEWE